MPKHCHTILTGTKYQQLQEGFIKTWNSRQVQRLLTVAKVNLLYEQ